ncbi:MAG: aminopeptidase [Vicinamibacterales bacterium]
MTTGTTTEFDERLQRYADAAIRSGLNLQPGQRLMMIGPRLTGGVSLEAAPLVRALTTSAYRAGAPLVEVLWGDEALQLLRFQHAPTESFAQFSSWLPKALVEHIEGGHALLSIYANDPDLMAGLPSDRVGTLQQAASRGLQPFSELIGKNSTNWLVIGAASARWAAKVFNQQAVAQATSSLWDAIFRMCRIDGVDAAAGWTSHLDALVHRSEYLNERRYRSLLYRGPGTELTIGLPDRHVWVSGRSVSAQGIPFAPNMPTEEVFTMPHRDRVDGVVRSSKPLSYGGVMIEDFSLRFAAGRIVDVTAARGESVLRHMIASDEGAAKLGELALVPHSSPISQAGVLFYNTLFDENAASHLAVGAAYRFTMEGGEAMTDEAFAAAGGNRSMIHVDFMIGHDRLDIDGVRPDGTTEAVMRHGEWATAV